MIYAHIVVDCAYVSGCTLAFHFSYDCSLSFCSDQVDPLECVTFCYTAVQISANANIRLCPQTSAFVFLSLIFPQGLNY